MHYILALAGLVTMAVAAPFTVEAEAAKMNIGLNTPFCG
jgi:hypothetical protein